MGMLYSKFLSYIPLVPNSRSNEQDIPFDEIDPEAPFIYYHIDDFNDDYSPLIPRDRISSPLH